MEFISKAVGVDDVKKAVWELYREARKSCQMAVSFVVVMWVFSILDLLSGQRLVSQGIHPREFPMGYLAMIWSFFMHASIGQLIANSIPFFVLSSLLLVRSRTEYLFLTIIHVSTAGTLVWALGSEGSNFVGSSSLIFAYFAYLISIGILERDLISIGVSVVTLFLYGSMALSLFIPASSEGIINLLGFCIGTTFAIAHSKYLKNLSACATSEPALDEENSDLLGKSAFDDTEAEWGS